MSPLLRERSDSDSETHDYVQRTYQDGDAHSVESMSSNSETYLPTTHSISEQIESRHKESLEYNDDAEKVSREKVVESSRRTIDSHTDDLTLSLQEPSPEETRKRTLEENDTGKESARQDKIGIGSEMAEETSSTDEEQKPIPKPRRSAREKKAPDRYGEYIMYRMTDQRCDKETTRTGCYSKLRSSWRD